MAISYHILGDTALIVRFEQQINPAINGLVQQFKHSIELLHLEGILHILPNYCDITLFYDPSIISFQNLISRLKTIDIQLEQTYRTVQLLHIPVCYNELLGIDIAYVAKYNHINIDEVIKKHSSQKYLVYMLGFTPGFTYLGGLDPMLSTPRLDTPRKVIPAGSVGIAGNQTGIYPIDSPGGWQIIGQTPIKMFDINREPEVLVESGDYIQFDPVTFDEYQLIKEKIRANLYKYQLETISMNNGSN